MKIFFYLGLFIFFLVSFTDKAFAIYDPLSKPNNIYGIHVLFPDEIFQARDLVNSKGGEWGYITIPIQISDKDLDKWQTFMDDARDLQLIPILRLATNGDYFNTKVWQKPKHEDILDFANFLNSLDWPTKNRYVIVFNEVNRSDEWGGTVSPFEYAEILDFAIETFKSKNQDFFVISAGLDNAAPDKLPEFMNEYDFLYAMEAEKPGIFAKIDGIASHSYPNPGFSQPPNANTTKSIYSFRYESSLINSFADKNLPIFITETGWSSLSVPKETIAAYFFQAFSNAWKDESIVAVTPFLLRAGQGVFTQFSFINEDGEKSEMFKGFEEMNKIKGKPQVAPAPKKSPFRQVTLPIRKFFYKLEAENELVRAIKPTKSLFKWLLKI